MEVDVANPKRLGVGRRLDAPFHAGARWTAFDCLVALSRRESLETRSRRTRSLKLQES